jgi:nucleoside phosphorylase
VNVPRDRLKAVLDALTSLGWRDVAGAAVAVADALPDASRSGDPAAAVGRALPADWLAVHSTTRADAGSALCRVLTGEIAAAAGDSPGRTRPQVDLVVVTALGLEHGAVRAHLSGAGTVTSTAGTVYTVGRLGGAGPHAALVETGQGNAAAAAETERALALFTPRAVLFVGVAGGLKDNPLGTVVAAEHIYDYSHIAEDPDGLRGRVKTHAGAYRAVQAARAAARDGTWTSRRVEPAAGWPDPGAPGAVVKPIAAGPRLVRDSAGDTARWLDANCNDAAAVEMEGWGFLQAAYAHPGSPALVVRAISDRLGDKTADQDARWQPAAAANAAAFAADVALRLLDG